MINNLFRGTHCIDAGQELLQESLYLQRLTLKILQGGHSAREAIMRVSRGLSRASCGGSISDNLTLSASILAICVEKGGTVALSGIDLCRCAVNGGLELDKFRLSQGDFSFLVFHLLFICMPFSPLSSLRERFAQRRRRKEGSAPASSNCVASSLSWAPCSSSSKRLSASAYCVKEGRFARSAASALAVAIPAVGA